MNVVGVDVGGANLKASDGRTVSVSLPFELWKQPEQLPNALRDLVSTVCPQADVSVVATMTGELADCFASKEEGVNRIVDALQFATPSNRLRVYLTDGRIVAANEAREAFRLAAASNWHVMASFLARGFSTRPPRPPERLAIMLDVGSTTCDLIPLRHGQVASQGRTDTARLQAGELLYMGVERTPLCGITTLVPYRGHPCPLACELFATTGDVYLTLGELPENEANRATADRRPATRPFAQARLARAICADVEAFDERDALCLAHDIASKQAQLLAAAIDRLFTRMTAESCSAERPLANAATDDDAALLVTGHGDFLVRRAVACCLWRPAQIRYGVEELGAAAARVGPAYALAALVHATPEWFETS